MSDDLLPLDKKHVEMDGPVRRAAFAEKLVNFDDAVAAVKEHWEKRKPEILNAIQLNNWNPLVKPNRTYTGIVYEGLLTVAADGFTLQPSLATAWNSIQSAPTARSGRLSATAENRALAPIVATSR